MPDNAEEESGPEDPTTIEEIRQETREKLDELEASDVEVLTAIALYLPQIVSHLDGIRKELTAIRALAKDGADLEAEDETVEQKNEEIREIMDDTQDLELNRIVSFFDSLHAE